MIKLELVHPQNAAIFKNIRLRAFHDSPTAFSANYADECKLTDSEWLDRAAQWTSGKSIAYLAMDASAAVGIAAGELDKNDPENATLMSMWVDRPIVVLELAEHWSKPSSPGGAGIGRDTCT